MCKNNIKLIYLILYTVHVNFEKHKQSSLSENYNWTFHNK